MSGKDHSFVEWKEEFISQERGNRVVHYFLKDSAGECILAVVGTERSVRHMFYVVSEEFLEVYGNGNSIHAGYKWRSRREVVDWLTSMLSKQHVQGDKIDSPNCDAAEAVKSSVVHVNLVSAMHTHGKGHLANNVNGHNSDIAWSGISWLCGKQLKHYPAFCRNGTKIAIQSFVFVMAKGDSHYVAYLEDMYEDKRGQKKVKVRWFHHIQEVKGVVPIRNHHPREVFITPYSQVISAECVDGPATVLNREHYEKCSPAIPPNLLERVHVCFRQFRSNKVKPFDLRKLRGYLDQPILSCLASDSFPKHESRCHSLTADEDEEFSAGDNVKLGNKRTRSGGRSPRILANNRRVKKISRHQQMMAFENGKDVNYTWPVKGLLSLKHLKCQPCYDPMSKVDDKIELLCQDSGIRGCWFRCTVVQVSRKQMKVRYDDVQDEDGCGNLEEWVPAFKLAVPDKLGMRHLGRLTIRPAPIHDGQGELALEVGSAIDAWWSDGWWEGVITRVVDCNDDNPQVYFPGESLLMNVDRKDLRKSRDWLGDSWIEIEPKHDIAKAIFGINSSNTKHFMSSGIPKDIKSGGRSCLEVPVCNESNMVEEKQVNSSALASSDGSPDNTVWARDKKLPLQKEKSSEDDNIDTNGSCNNEENETQDKESDSGDDDKDAIEDDDDNDDNNDIVDMETLGTSEQDCKAVEVTEMAA